MDGPSRGPHPSIPKIARIFLWCQGKSTLETLERRGGLWRLLRPYSDAMNEVPGSDKGLVLSAFEQLMEHFLKLAA
jgi:hypothetical protein